MRIDENLRIVSVESVDTHLHKTAVLTVVLNAYAGLETKPLSQTSRVGVVENLAVEDVHQAGALRRVVSLRLAETTTSSMVIPFSVISKLSSRDCPFLSDTSWRTGS